MTARTSRVRAHQTIHFACASISLICTLVILSIIECSCSFPNSTSIQVDMNEPIELDALKANSPSEVATVQATLTSCSISSHLPNGYKKTDIFGYDEARETFNAANDLYAIDDNGYLNNTWLLVTTMLSVKNDNNFSCKVNLGTLRIAHIEDNQNLVTIADYDPWIINGTQTKEEYYLPTLTSHSHNNFIIGFFIPKSSLTQADCLLAENRKDQGDSTTVKTIYIGDITRQYDTSS